MSKYTTQLRYILESLANKTESVGYNDINEVINTARPRVFNFSYGLEESHKEQLETKILYHFYLREIGMETYGLWKLRLQTKLNEIAPYYNELYASVDKQMEIDPFNDIDVTTTHTRDNTENVDNVGTGTSNNQSSNTSKTTDRFSDTPQGALTNIENNTYLTTADIVDNTGSGTNNTTTNTRNDIDTVANEQFTQHVVGKRGGLSYMSLLKEYRQNILNIDMMIIEELEELFIQLW